MRGAPAALLALLLLLPLPAGRRACADEDAPLPTAADVTERGRSLDRILDMALPPVRPPGPEGRSLTFLVDVSASFARARLAEALDGAFERHAKALVGTRLGLARTGRKGRPLLRPTADHALFRQTLREVGQAPTSRFENVYADVRRILPQLAREKGMREVVLVTFDNGDAEDDVEATVKALDRAGVRFSAITREAFLSDTWWALKPPNGPRGTRFTGAEAAFIELPWGFRYQGLPANTSVLSGFAMFGPTRLAAATGGKVYLYYPAEPLAHECIHPRYGFCPFCSGDHVPQNEIYQAHRLRELSPLAVSRREAMEVAAKDPYYRAVLRAWERSAKYGLVYSRPSLKRTGEGLRLESRPYKGWGPLGYTVAFASEAAHAGRLVHALDLVLRELDEGIAEAAEKGGHPHFRAVADTTRLLLAVTRMNLLLFRAYCREVGPEHARARAVDADPPEKGVYPDDSRFRYVSYRSMSLCHGVAPFRDLRLPGGDVTDEGLRDLEKAYAAFARRYAHTPWLTAVRRSGLARFHLVLNPRHTPYGRRIPPSKKDETVTLPERPSRPARPGTSGGGVTSGG